MFACCLPIVRMYGIEPPQTQAFIRVLASEFVPPLREERARAVWLGHPEHRRGSVGKVTEPFFALLEGLLGPLVLRHHDCLVSSEPQQQPFLLSWKVYPLGTSN